MPQKDAKSTVIEIYNSVLSMARMTENSDLTLPIDNPAITRYLTHNYPIACPTLEDHNYLLGQVLSNLTSASRFRCYP